jgi:hypothetical protein
VITRQTLLIYNFGIAAIFVLVGALSMFALSPLLDRPTIQPPFDVASMAAIQAEQDMEKLRARAAFYFDLGRDLKRARYADTDIFFADFRNLCFALGVIFAIGGAISLAATRTGPQR